MDSFRFILFPSLNLSCYLKSPLANLGHLPTKTLIIKLVSLRGGLDSNQHNNFRYNLDLRKIKNEL